MAANTVLDLLLTARYVGGPAFREMSADIDALVAKTDGFTRMGAAFNLVGDAMIATGVAAAAGLGMATDYALNYQDAINRIVAVTPDLRAHKDELAQLNAQIQQSAVKYAQDPVSVAQGAYYLFSSLGVLGQPASALLNNHIISDIAAYSRASGPVGQGGVSFGDAAQLLPRIFAAANAPMNQWGGDLGVLTFLENRAHMTQAQLANSITAFLPMVTALGMSVPDAATLMTAIASSGRVGAPAGREEMSALTLMLSGKTQQAELAHLGLKNSMFFDKNGEMLPPEVMLAIIGSKLRGMSKPDQLIAEKNLFGQVGMRAMTPLLSGMDKYSNLIGEEKKLGIYNNPQGAQAYMMNIAAQMMNSPKMQLMALGEAFKVLAIQVGTALLPPLMQFAHWLTQIVLTISGFVQAHPQLTKNIALAAAPALIGGGVGMKGIGALLPLIGAHRANMAKEVEDHHSALNAFWNTVAGKNSTYERAKQADALAREAQSRSSLNALTQEYKAERGRLHDRTAAKLAANFDEERNYPLAQQIFAPRDFRAERRAMRGEYKRELGMYRENYRSATENLLGGLNKPFRLEGEVFPLKPQELDHANIFKRLYGFGSKAPGRIVGADWEGILQSGFGLNAPIAKMANTVAHPIESFKKLGSVIADLARNGFGLLKTAIMGLPELLGGILAVGLPLIAILLVIGGAIAIGVLAFTRYRTQTEHLVQVFEKALKPAFELVAAAVHTFIDEVKAIWEKMAPKIDEAMAKLYPALEKLAPLLQFIGMVVGAVIATILAVLTGLVNGFLTALPPIIGFFSQIANIISSTFAFISDLIHGNWAAAWHDFLNIFGSAFAAVGDLLKGVWDFIGGFVQGIIGFFQTLFDVLVGHSIIPDLITEIVNWFLKLPDEIPQIISALLNLLEQDFLNLASAALQWGVNFLQMLGQGIVSAEQFVLSPVIDLANNIVSFLGFNSPPKAGPLSHSDVWMPNMMSMMGQGITNNTGRVMGPLNNLTSQVNTALANIANNGAVTSGNINQAIDNSVNADIARLNQTIQAAQHAYQITQGQGYGPTYSPSGSGQTGPGAFTDQSGLTPAEVAQQQVNAYYAKQGLYSPYNLPEGVGGPKGQDPTDLFGMGHYQQYLQAYTATYNAWKSGQITDWKSTLQQFVNIQGDSQHTQLQNYMTYLQNLENAQAQADATMKAHANGILVQTDFQDTMYASSAQRYQEYLQSRQVLQNLYDNHYLTQDQSTLKKFTDFQDTADSTALQKYQAYLEAFYQSKVTGYQQQENLDKQDYTKVEGMTKQHFLNLQNAANAAAAPALQAGTNVVQGFVNGILNNLFKIDNAGAQIGAHVSAATRAGLGINSPSTVFHYFGQMSVEGYKQGVLTHSPSLANIWGAFGPLGSTHRGGALRFDSLHVGELHAAGLGGGQQNQNQSEQERMPAWTMSYAQSIQARRERLTAYDTHLDDFDINYRRASQYQA